MSPFSSKAQAGYLHSHPEKLGKAGLKEWDSATKGRHLPEHVKTYDSGGVVTPQKDNMGIYDKVVNAAKGAAAAIKAGNDETDSIGAGLAERAKMTRAAMGKSDEAKPVEKESVSPTAGGNSPYGSRKGEKRLDTSYLDKPTAIKAPVYDKGGKVNVNDGKHEVAILKHGERVLTEKQDKKYQAMKAEHGEPDADDVKVYDKGGKVTPMAGMFDQITKGGDKPKKEISEMSVKKSHNGKHIVTHKHHSPSHHPDET